MSEHMLSEKKKRVERIKFFLICMSAFLIFCSGCFRSGEIYLSKERQNALACKGFRPLETGWPPLVLMDAGFPEFKEKARAIVADASPLEKEFYPFFLFSLFRILRLTGHSDVNISELMKAFITGSILEVRTDLFSSACLQEILLAMKLLAPVFFSPELVHEIALSRIRLSRFRDFEAFILPAFRKGNPVFVMITSAGSLRFMGEKIENRLDAAHILMAYGAIEGAAGSLLLVVDSNIDSACEKKIGCDYGILLLKNNELPRLFPQEYERMYSPITGFYIISPGASQLKKEMVRSLREVSRRRGYPLPDELEIAYAEVVEASRELSRARRYGTEDEIARHKETRRAAVRKYIQLFREKKGYSPLPFQP